MKLLMTLALRHRLITIGLALAAAAAGLVSLSRVPFDAFPDLTGVRVDVIASAPGMAPEDIERLVTYPLESALMGLPGTEGVRSTSKFGLALLTVPFEDGTDVYFARTLVQQRLAEAKSGLPPGVEPTLGPLSTPMGELYQYAVTSASLSQSELKSLHDYVIRPRLRTVPGVSEVNSWGGLTEQIQVDVDPVALAARGLVLADVHRALAENNRSFGGSYIEQAGERYTVRGLGRLDSLGDIGQIALRARNGMSVRIADVATVQSGAVPRHGAVTKDGTGEVVSGMVLKLKGADSRRVMIAVKERMKEIEAALPAGVVITPFYDQTELINRTSQTIIKNLIEGGLLVVAVLFLFLRNVRASLIVASVIPLSMLMAFIGMDLFGYSANLMSLGALDFGLIVDASVVMVENFVRRMEHPPTLPEGTPADPMAQRRALFRSAALEVGRPILFGIAIIVAVYIPIFSLSGMEGRMFKPMAFTVVCAVLGSLLLALTFVPALSATLLTHVPETTGGWLDRLRVRYASALDWTLRRGTPVVAVAVLVVLASVGSLTRIGTEFMPKLDEGAILINTRRMPSVSLDDAVRMSTTAEKIVLKFPEVITVVTKEGRPDLATEAMGLFEGDLYVILKDRREWTTATTTEGLVAALDAALRGIPGLSISFTQPLAMRLDEAESGIRTDLGVKVIGRDIAENQRIGQQILQILATTSGSADAAVEVSEGTGQIRVAVRRPALAQYGLSVADVQHVVELALGAQVATELVDGPRRIGVAVRLPNAARNDISTLERLTIRAPDGALVPLGAVAELVSGTGPELIGHENAQRRTLVLSNVRGRDLGSFVGEVRRRVASEVTLPAGMFLEWGGQYENQQRAMGRLTLVVPAALLLIFVLLYASFRSLPQAALVLLNVPFALAGGIAALWLRGLNLNLSASVGFIALFGIAVLNGVVLISHLNALREEGMDLERAVREGASDRLRPVLMTALVASLGFIPMALSTSPGSEVQRPLASVVIGGLLTSTCLTLFVLPILYRALSGWQTRRSRAATTVPAEAGMLHTAH